MLLLVMYMDKSLKKNILDFKEMFSSSADFTIREFKINTPKGKNAAVFTMEGMCNKETLAISVINPIMGCRYRSDNGTELLEVIKTSVITASEMVDVKDTEMFLTLLMSGFAIIAVDGCENMLAIGLQGFSFRSVSEPSGETIQRGSREGFVEPLRINMTLIRRRIKSPKLVFETMTVGTLSKTQICLCYLSDRISKQILKKLKEELNKCDLETVLAAGYLVPFLEDNEEKSLFTGVGISERPDTVCGKITEGRIAVMIDGSPSVLYVPKLFVENFQSFDDYSNRPYYAAFTRVLKYISFLAAIYIPGLYVAFATFHPELFSPGILSKIVSSVTQTPLPLMLEVLLIHFIYEIMREAGLRIPKPLGHAVGIVGALVIGESAVSAGIIGSPTLMVVAIAAIASYTIPDLYPCITILRLVYIICGGILGLWGIVLVSFVMLLNLCGKNSFGVPYASPFAPFMPWAMRDTFIRASWKKLAKKVLKIQDVKGADEER